MSAARCLLALTAAGLLLAWLAAAPAPLPRRQHQAPAWPVGEWKGACGAHQVTLTFHAGGDFECVVTAAYYRGVWRRTRGGVALAACPYFASDNPRDWLMPGFREYYRHAGPGVIEVSGWPGAGPFYRSK